MMKKTDESLKTDTSASTPKVSKITKLFIAILCLSLLIGILAIIGSWMTPADEYDMARLPRYDDIKSKLGDSLEERFNRTHIRREFYTWIDEEGGDVWWKHEYYPDLEIISYRDKSEGEKLADVQYLNDLVQDFNSKIPAFEWSWKLKGTSYDIVGQVPEKTWLERPIKAREELLASIYEEVVKATKIPANVSIIAEDTRLLGIATGPRIDILVKVSPERLARQDLKHQTWLLCKHLNSEHQSKYSSISPKWKLRVDDTPEKQ